MVKVLVVGQTPPPFHGQAMMIDRLVHSELADVQIVHVRMGFSASIDEVGRVHLSKIFHLFALILRIVWHRIASGAKILYYPPAGPHYVPLIRDMAILLSTRWMFQRTILHFHASGMTTLYRRMPRWQRWLFRRAFFGVDAAVRISELTPPDGAGIEARREYIVPNGIDDPWPESRPQDCLPATQEHPFRILFVGMLHEGKGVTVLIDACKRLAARGVPFQLELMGQPADQQFMEQLRGRIAELQLDEHVHFLGVLKGEKKLDAFDRADVLCHPTFYDTFPVVLLEAMAARLPVVSTRFSGIPSIVDDGMTGYLVEPHDPEAVAEQLARLAQDTQLRKQMGEAGRQKFLREFTWSRHLERMREVFLNTSQTTTVEKETSYGFNC